MHRSTAVAPALLVQELLRAPGHTHGAAVVACCLWWQCRAGTGTSSGICNLWRITMTRQQVQVQLPIWWWTQGSAALYVYRATRPGLPVVAPAAGRYGRQDALARAAGAGWALILASSPKDTVALSCTLSPSKFFVLGWCVVFLYTCCVLACAAKEQQAPERERRCSSVLLDA